MTQTTATPIQITWKISEVLRRYPALLETIIGMSPAFRRLNNPVMRKVQSRLVTVEQAARIAGISPDEMARQLNAAAGIDTATATAARRVVIARETVNEPEWARMATVSVDLDVRPLQERGEEPFAAIMNAVRQVAPGEVLRLRNTFEPVPLYDVLRMRGFDHVSRQLSQDDWEVLFLNSGDRPARFREPVEEAESSTSSVSSGETAATTITIDVSDLIPPEPMVRILDALEALPPSESLFVYHVRRPMFLYPQLDALGYLHETREIATGHVEIVIHKPAAGK